MKKTIFIFLITLNVFANYIPKDEIGSGNTLTVFTKKNRCESYYYSKTCIRIPFGYNHEFHILIDELDMTKPIHSKNDIETCNDDQAICETLNATKTCTDNTETVYMAQDYSEIYCSKITGHQTTGKKIIVENASAKAAYLAAIQSKQAAANTQRALMKTYKTKLMADQALSAGETKKLFKYLLKHLK